MKQKKAKMIRCSATVNKRELSLTVFKNMDISEMNRVTIMRMEMMDTRGHD
jgi:hypothetical protein